MVTIGITGTIGAGKGVIVDYLVKKKGFKHYSVREFLLQEIVKRGIEETRDSMWSVANEMRKKYSPSYIMERLIEERKKHPGNAVIESQRAVAEVDVLKASLENFYLIAVDAQPELRYKRILARKSSTDNVTLEQFIEHERQESISQEPWSGNLEACIKKADVVIENNGSFDELYVKIEEVLAKLPA